MPPNLLEIAIRMVPRTRLWMFSSVMSGLRPVKHPGERLAETLHRVGDGHDVVAHAQRLGARGRIRQALVGGIAVGQHHAVHALRPQRVDGHAPRHSAESMPPDRPSTTPGKPFLST